jgi:hypothetical protein
MITAQTWDLKADLPFLSLPFSHYSSLPIIILVFSLGTLRMFVPYSELPLHPIPPPQLFHLLRLFVIVPY